MKRSLSQCTPSLIEAITLYNFFLKLSNAYKSYKKPEMGSSVDYQIAEHDREEFDDLEMHRISALNDIHELLLLNHGDNIPKGELYGLAKDKDLLELLVQYGASPILESDGPYSTRLHVSFKPYEYFKIYSLISSMSFKSKPKDMDYLAKVVLSYTIGPHCISLGYYEVEVDYNYKNKVINLLNSKLDSTPIILKLIANAGYNNKLELPNVLKYHYLQSVWIALCMVAQQENNLFGVLPREVLILIMTTTNSYFSKSPQQFKILNDRFQKELDQENRAKHKAFSVIYTLLLENNSYLTRYSSIESDHFYVIKYLHGARTTLRNIEDLALAGDPLVIKAWDLMLEHYENLNGDNQLLIEALTQWAFDNSFKYQFSFFSANMDWVVVKDTVTKRLNELLLMESPCTIQKKVDEDSDSYKMTNPCGL